MIYQIKRYGIIQDNNGQKKLGQPKIHTLFSSAFWFVDKTSITFVHRCFYNTFLFILKKKLKKGTRGTGPNEVKQSQTWPNGDNQAQTGPKRDKRGKMG